MVAACTVFFRVIISLQRVCSSGLTTILQLDYRNGKLVLSAQSGNAVSGTSSVVKLLEPRMKRANKAMSRGVAIAGAWVFLGGIVVPLYRGECELHHAEYTDRHRASGARQSKNIKADSL